MSSVFGSLGKKISSTLDNAQKDLRFSVAKSLSAAATTIATSSTDVHPPGTKSKLFSAILDRSRRVRDKIVDRRSAQGIAAQRTLILALAQDAAPYPGANIAAPSELTRDDVQGRLASFVRLEKEFCDLIEAYQILLMERIHLEEIISGNSQLDSLDDLELVGQYYKAVQDTSQVETLWKDCLL